MHSPVLCCEGNIRGRTSWVCIHPYSVAKATSVAVRRGCAFTRTLLRRQHPWPYVVAGVHSPVLCCEGNIRGRTSWRVCIHPYCVARTSSRVCIHPYSFAKATSVAERRGCALTHTFIKAIVYSLPCAVKPGTMSVCNRVSQCLCVTFV